MLNVFQHENDRGEKSLAIGRLRKDTISDAKGASVPESIESTCRNGVSSVFSFEVEREVARVLFFAVCDRQLLCASN